MAFLKDYHEQCQTFAVNPLKTLLTVRATIFLETRFKGVKSHALGVDLNAVLDWIVFFFSEMTTARGLWVIFAHFTIIVGLALPATVFCAMLVRNSRRPNLDRARTSLLSITVSSVNGNRVLVDIVVEWTNRRIPWITRLPCHLQQTNTLFLFFHFYSPVFLPICVIARFCHFFVIFH